MSKPQHQRRIGAGIDRDEIIGTLRAHQAELRRRGVGHAALFGSVARGEGKRTSDLDIRIELDPQAPVELFEYVELRNTSKTCSRPESMSPTAAV